MCPETPLLGKDGMESCRDAAWGIPLSCGSGQCGWLLSHGSIMSRSRRQSGSVAAKLGGVRGDVRPSRHLRGAAEGDFPVQTEAVRVIGALGGRLREVGRRQRARSVVGDPPASPRNCRTADTRPTFTICSPTTADKREADTK